MAWEPLGWSPFAFAEVDKFPSAVLAHHWPKVPNLGDMTKYEEWPDANIDVLAGGTPCQSFSVAGLRKGLDDPRGNLMLTYGAIAAKYRPTWLAWENVPGVLSSNGGRDFGTFLGMLGQLGYGFSYRVLDAQYFGVAQRRRRVFVVGHIGDWRRAAAVRFERHSLSGHSAPSREAREVAPTIPARRSGGGGLGTDFDCDGGLIQPYQTANCLTARTAKGMNSTLDEGQTPVIGFPANMSGTQCATTENLAPSMGAANPIAVAIQNATRGKSQNGLGVSDPGDPMYTLDNASQHGVAVPILEPGARTGKSTTDKRAGLGVGEDGDPMFTLQAGKQHGVAQTVALRGRDGGATAELGGETATALRASSGGGDKPHVLSQMSVRRLTPTECERLQGFPDGHTAIPWRGKSADQCPDGPRYKALGNSMAVPVMRWLGERIQQVGGIA